MLTKVKQKTCRECKIKFTPTRAIQPVCSNYECMCAYANKAAEKSAIARKKKEIRQHKEKLEAGKTVRERIKETQRFFNLYIRTRDYNKPCISCGREHIPEQIGGAWDCGHFLGVGARPDLRFDEKNAHKQCKSCNGGAGKYAKKNYTVSQSYRINLIERIGLAEVERLEGKPIEKRYRAEELDQLKIKYKELTKALKAQHDT